MERARIESSSSHRSSPRETFHLLHHRVDVVLHPARTPSRTRTPTPPHTPTGRDPQNGHTPRRPTIYTLNPRLDVIGHVEPPRARAVPAVVGPRMGRDSAGDDDRGVVDRARWRFRRLRRSIDRSSRRSGAVVRGRSIDESKNQRTNRSIESNRDRSSRTTTTTGTTVTRGGRRIVRGGRARAGD